MQVSMDTRSNKLLIQSFSLIIPQKTSMLDRINLHVRLTKMNPIMRLMRKRRRDMMILRKSLRKMFPMNLNMNMKLKVPQNMRKKRVMRKMNLLIPVMIRLSMSMMIFLKMNLLFRRMMRNMSMVMTPHILMKQLKRRLLADCSLMTSILRLQVNRLICSLQQQIHLFLLRKTEATVGSMAI